MQDPIFDINEIIAKFIDAKTSEIFKLTRLSITKLKNVIGLRTKKKYTKYLFTIAQKYGNTKSFFYRDNPQPLYDFYIPVGLECNSEIIESANINGITSINKRAVIRGIGGTGKTIILKHLLLDSLKKNYKVPVFIELRDLDESDIDLADAIYKSLNVYGLKIDEDYFKRSLENGHYVFLLDGLDEIPIELREIIIREIEKLSKRYRKCGFIVTSRPDDKLNQLKTFDTFKTVSLSLEKCVALLNKLPTDEVFTEKFIQRLEAGLFEEHKSFLSNPLLLSIMLLTYKYSADIPNKLSVFYNQAYETLFHGHDNIKGAYKRKKETDLGIMEFEEIFSVFSLYTYSESKITFSKGEARKFLKRTKNIIGIQFNIESYLNDLQQAVCLLYDDGLFLSYTHRSFQEYFVTKFISLQTPDVKHKLIAKFKDNTNTDQVLKLLLEIDPVFVEREVLIPFIEKLFSNIGLSKRITQLVFLNYLKLIARGVFNRFGQR